MPHNLRFIWLTRFDEEGRRVGIGYRPPKEWSETSFEQNVKIPLKNLKFIWSDELEKQALTICTNFTSKSLGDPSARGSQKRKPLKMVNGHNIEIKKTTNHWSPKCRNTSSKANYMLPFVQMFDRHDQGYFWWSGLSYFFLFLY